MCDLTESKDEGLAKESALRAYYQRLEVGHKHVVFLQSLLQWDLRSTKEWKSKERRVTGGRHIIRRWRENFLMFLNLENLHKVPTSSIEKEQTFITDIKNLFVLCVLPQQQAFPHLPFWGGIGWLFPSSSPPHHNLPTKMFWFLGALSEKPKRVGKKAQTGKLLYRVRSQNTGSFEGRQGVGGNTRRSFGGSRMVYFLIWVLATWVCSACKNSWAVH